MIPVNIQTGKNCDTVNPEDTLAFNGDLAEVFNHKAVALDSRLYCFIHYNPMIPKSESWEASFYYAVRNLYALVQDCGVFLPFISSHPTKAVLFNVNNDERINLKRWITEIKDLRATFMHNCSPYLGIENQDHVTGMNNYIGIVPVCDEDWKRPYIRLIRCALSIERLLTDIFDKRIPNMTKDMIDRLIEQWFKKVVIVNLQHRDTIRMLILTWYNLANEAEASLIGTTRNNRSWNLSKYSAGEWIRTHIEICKNPHKSLPGQVDSLLNLSDFTKCNKAEDYFECYMNYLISDRIADLIKNPHEPRNQFLSYLPEGFYADALKYLRKTPLLYI